ncbi:MAG: HYR domain-containing protein [Gaiellaceae bacterium]
MTVESVTIKRDATPPSLSVPAGVVVNATSPAGAVVSFAVSASDGIDPSPTAACAPGSGGVFAIGATTVSCTATDAAGNAATASFQVHVKGAGEQLADLAAAVEGWGPARASP